MMSVSRWALYLQAWLLRTLSFFTPLIFRLYGHRPVRPSFVKKVRATRSARPGQIRLYFYTPKDYAQRAKTKKYPVVVNFHGGGFSLGTALDDNHWADTIVQDVDAVVVSVAYRLAPEHPFPTAVDDGVDAILYICEHSEELGIDPSNIAVSGFSAGGNLCLTVPLRLQEHLKQMEQQGQKNPCQIRAIVAWYPSTDFTRSRESRAAAMPRPDKQLPRFLTKLFDEGYIYPSCIDLSNPFLSPGLAPDSLLVSLPNNILFYTCEWDMLCAEARDYAQRLERDIKKNVKYTMVEGVVHGWDKHPNPVPKPDQYYRDACQHLRRVFKVNTD